MHYIIDHSQLRQLLASKFTRKIGNALESCHRNSILHRDRSLENILMSQTRDIKLSIWACPTCTTRRVIWPLPTDPPTSPLPDYSTQSLRWPRDGHLGCWNHSLYVGLRKDAFRRQGRACTARKDQMKFGEILDVVKRRYALRSYPTFCVDDLQLNVNSCCPVC